MCIVFPARHLEIYHDSRSWAPAGELQSKRKASKRQASRVLESAATSQAAAIAAVAASSGATYLDAAARGSDHRGAPQPPPGPDGKGLAPGPSTVSRSFLDPLGVFEKVIHSQTG